MYGGGDADFPDFFSDECIVVGSYEDAVLRVLHVLKILYGIYVPVQDT